MAIARLPFLLILFVSVCAHAWNTPTSAFKGAKYTAWTWTGAAGDHDWNNGANWCGAYLNDACQGQSAAPTASSNVVFNDACTGTNCNVTMPGTAVTVKNFQMSDTYTGTITQGTTNLTITGSFSQANGTFNQTTGFINCSSGGSSWYMFGGTFNGGSANITVNLPTNGNVAHFALTGGSFRSTTGTLSVNVAYNEITFAPASFDANGGTIYISAGSHTNSDADITWPASSLNDVIIDGTTGKQLTFLNDATITGNLTLTTGAALVTATLMGPGKLYVQKNVNHSGSFDGTSSIVLSGAALQVVDSTACDPAYIGIIGILIQQTSIAASVRFDGNIRINGSFIATASTNLGTVNLNGALFDLASTNNGATSTFDSDIVTFPTLTISAPGPYSKFGNLTITGDLKITYNGNCSSSSIGGIIKVGGNIDATTGSLCGASLNIELNGAGTQVVDTGGSAMNYVPGIKINKTSGQVEFKNSVNGKFKMSGDFIFAAGGIATSALTMPTVSDLSLAGANTTIQTNGFEFPAGKTVHFISDSSGSIVTLNDELTIRGNLKFDDNPTYIASFAGVVANMNISLYGNLTCGASAKGYQSNLALNPVGLRLRGAGQTVDVNSCASAAYLPRLSVESTGGTTTITTGTKTIRMTNYVYVSGTVDATAANITFNNASATVTTYPGPTEFGNVTFNTANAHIINSGETLKVNGVFTIDNSVTTRTLTGNIDVYGNYVIGTQGALGAATVNLKGNSSTMTIISANPTGLLTIAKTAGQTVTLGASKVLSGGQSISITSGSLDLNGFNLTTTGSLTLAAGTTVKLSAGTLTVGGVVLTAGPYSGGTIVP